MNLMCSSIVNEHCAPVRESEHQWNHSRRSFLVVCISADRYCQILFFIDDCSYGFPKKVKEHRRKPERTTEHEVAKADANRTALQDAISQNNLRSRLSRALVMSFLADGCLLLLTCAGQNVKHYSGRDTVRAPMT